MPLPALIGAAKSVQSFFAGTGGDGWVVEPPAPADDLLAHPPTSNVANAATVTPARTVRLIAVPQAIRSTLSTGARCYYDAARVLPVP